ncbi:hypothetical protein ES288_A05G083400v1 [Gossypium darwinii]|uniref:FAF domain-containing protein n=1 Tax=Gossypium darwinii TaxID=34276 RepID=A0A5D2GCY1_GOSDA|nr:hypothetical protein ES288_A05G083400v1 [Gossypium darwinii]
MMTGPLSKSIGLSSALNITEEATNVTNNQGIVSILGSDTDQRPTKGSSLRRTLSADMSSKKWLTQLNNTVSSDELPVSIADSSSQEAEEENYQEKKALEKPAQFDIWTSIISSKPQDDSKPLPPPYIHPLVKRSGSCLSEKSLEICTESLGSETGSDGFSSYPPSETGDVEEDRKEEDQRLRQQKLASYDDEDDQPRILKYNNDVVAKKAPHHGSFPPPIPSLSRKDGASIRMETHRDNGWLVLEAVSVPSKKNFLAQRQDGRLVLTLAMNEVMMIEEAEEVEEFESFGDEEKGTDQMDIIGEEEEGDRGCEMEKANKLSSGAMNVHRLAVMMNKPIWLANRNPTWPETFDEIVKFGEEEEEKIEPSTPPPVQSLSPRPRMARLIPSPPPPPSSTTTTAASFNSYEYYWNRPNQPMSPKAAILAPPALNDNSDSHLILSQNQTAKDQQQLLVLRGNNGDYFVPLLKGCRETRSLLLWDTYCIATS